MTFTTRLEPKPDAPRAEFLVIDRANEPQVVIPVRIVDGWRTAHIPDIGLASAGG